VPKKDSGPSESVPTNVWRPCPEAAQAHPTVRTGCMVMRGPKSYWYACAVCGTRVLLAIKLIHPNKGALVTGLSREDAEAQNLLCL
jgi:hypothetical protein